MLSRNDADVSWRGVTFVDRDAGVSGLVDLKHDLIVEAKGGLQHEATLNWGHDIGNFLVL